MRSPKIILKIQKSREWEGYEEWEEWIKVYGIRATGREVGFVLGVLSYPRISSSVPRSAIPAKLSPLLAMDRRLLGL